MWSQTYGKAGDKWDWARAMVATSDGGYIVAGNTASLSEANDIWLVKTDAFGNMEWKRTLSGQYGEWACSLVATSDGGCAIAGTWNCTGSIIYLELNEAVYSGDFWLVKTDENGVVPEYSSWFVPALVLAATAFVIINKKRLIRTR